MSLRSRLHRALAGALCLALVAASSRWTAAGEDGGGPPAPRPGSHSSGSAADPVSPAPAPSPAAAPSQGEKKVPRKEEKGSRKKRFLRTAAGTALLVVVGALIVGGVSQSAFGERNTPPPR